MAVIRNEDGSISVGMLPTPEPKAEQPKEDEPVKKPRKSTKAK